MNSTPRSCPSCGHQIDFSEDADAQCLELLLLRFFLLQDLSNLLHKLPSLFPPEHLKALKRGFSLKLRGIKPKGLGLKELSKSIDTHIVRYLKQSSILSLLLKSSLPQPNQTWSEFLNSTLDEEAKKLIRDLSVEQEQYVELCELLLQDVQLQVENLDINSDASKRGGDNARDTRRLKPDGYVKHKVFYATDRQATGYCEYKGVRTMGGQPLHYGHVLVGIPAHHSKGQVEKPELWKEDADPLLHVVILGIDARSQKNKLDFVDMVKEDLNEHAKEILIYIHGYNVRFKDAVKRAGQLKHDLAFPGTVISYSWASRGKNNLCAYWNDEKTVMETVECLAAFIRLCSTELGATKMHILAHSMGNRAVIGALKKLYTDSEKPYTDSPSSCVPLTLRHIILAAADEKIVLFEEMMEALTGSADTQVHFSVYCHAKDTALWLSSIINRSGRLGLETHLNHNSSIRMKYLTRLEVIDATEANYGIDKLQHSYYGNVPQVLDDIHHLLQDKPADQRPGITCKADNVYAISPGQDILA